MSELDRLRHQADEQHEDFEEHVKKDDERFEEVLGHLRFLRDFADQVLAYMKVDTKDPN